MKWGGRKTRGISESAYNRGVVYIIKQKYVMILIFYAALLHFSIKMCFEVLVYIFPSFLKGNLLVYKPNYGKYTSN
jgi:hypothetical protein